MKINELAARIHANNKKWWTDLETGKPIKRNRNELLMLAITELSEAVEGIRKDLMDDHLPHRKMEEVELADAKIRLLDYAAGYKIELMEQAPSQAPFRDNKAESIFLICFTICMVQFGEGDDIDYLSAAVHSIDDYCKKFGLDLDGAVEEKIAYNLTRQDHSHEARKAANGKKF